MNRRGEKAQTAVLITFKVAAVVFLAACVWLKFSAKHPVLPLVCLALLTTLLMLMMIWYMITTGRIRAKGAKQRRSALLPFVYQKKMFCNDTANNGPAPANELHNQ